MRRRRNGAITFINVTLEYEYPSSWLLAELLLQRTANGVVVDAVHVQPTPHRLAYINRFTFAGKGVWHYVFFAVALLVPMVMGIAFVQVFRTPGLQLRWLWAAIVLIGAGRFTLNWTTNRVSIILLAIQVLGSGFTRLGPDAPYLIATSVPVGAILFFIKRLTGIGEWDEMADGKGADMGQGPGEMGHGPGEGMGQGPGDMGHGPDGMADGGTTTDSAKPDE
jgi:hypothetical protein